MQPEYEQLSVEDQILLDLLLPSIPALIVGATLAQPSPGDSEEVAPTYVHPTRDTPPTYNVHLVSPENEILRANYRQRSQPPVPSFVFFGEWTKFITFNSLYGESRRVREFFGLWQEECMAQR